MTAREPLGPFTAGEIPFRVRWWYEADSWTVDHVAQLGMIRAEIGASPALDNRWPQEMVDAYCDAYNATPEVDDMAEALHVLSQCDPQDFI